MPALPRIVSLFARLEEPIDFEALDGEPVDLIFLLLAPEHAGADHLKALARISRLLREPATIEKLKAAKDRAALYSVLTEPAAHAAYGGVGQAAVTHGQTKRKKVVKSVQAMVCRERGVRGHGRLAAGNSATTSLSDRKNKE